MKRNNFSAAAGFGEGDRQGVFSTFAAFLEMVISELTMVRLNNANVLAHFSHSGVDWMADSNCHYGINNFFADGAIAQGDKTRLYFPADHYQLKALMKKIVWQKGVRFVFTTRSPTPGVLDDKGKPLFRSYTHKDGVDDVVRKGTKGYVVSYGDMLYRSLDAVERLRAKGIKVGLINKSTLNMVDEKTMKLLKKAPFVLVVESQNIKTGLGVRFGTWLLERGFRGKYTHLGTHKLGEGGVYEHIGHQGLEPAQLMKEIKKLVK